jgi:hypothetical protein
MARYITIGDEFINLDKVCNIQVYSRPATCNDEAIVEVEYDHFVGQIPCAGSEEEVRAQVRKAISDASKSFCPGPARAV